MGSPPAGTGCPRPGIAGEGVGVGAVKAGVAVGETGVAVAAPGTRRGRHAKPSNESNTAQDIQYLFITRLPIFRDSRKREKGNCSTPRLEKGIGPAGQRDRSRRTVG